MNKHLRYLGSLLALSLMSWVLYLNLGRLPTVDVGRPTVWLQLLAAVGLYVLSQLFGAWAWRWILRMLGEPVALWQTEGQLLVAQVGKYLPGNVGHLVGRLALARRDGVSTSAVGVGLMLEMASSVSVGLLLVGWAWLWDPAIVQGMAGHLLRDEHALGIVGVAGLALGAALLVYLWRRALGRDGRGAPRLRFVCLLPVFGANLMSFSVLGGSVWCVAQGVQLEVQVPFMLCLLTFVVAWVLGFITPGAPGGLGVRDALIAAGMSLSLGAPAALVVALVHRAVSVVGDVCAFGIGWMLRGRVRQRAHGGVAVDPPQAHGTTTGD